MKLLKEDAKLKFGIKKWSLALILANQINFGILFAQPNGNRISTLLLLNSRIHSVLPTAHNLIKACIQSKFNFF